MKSNRLRQIINECVRQVLLEETGRGRYTRTATPHHSKVDTQIFLGKNPLFADNGGHPSWDVVGQPSTFDEEAEIEHLFVSDNKFMIYKIKNFGNPDINDTIQLFGNTVEFRRAFDTVRGAAKRGGKPIFFRTISPETEKSKVERSRFMIKTFWEFSFDEQEWYILKPNPVQSLKISKFVKPD